jgi:3D (Asp-Asp-Asp) domain-containing protein/peptidoglycan hydrolase CwlO-like protein
MRSLKRIVAASLTSIILLSSTIAANAETSQETINNSENKLQQNAELINQKEAEKSNVSKELQNMQNDLQSIENNMVKNKEELAAVEQKMNETTELIEQKKEEIVVLEDKVHVRKGIMQERLVSLQHSDQASFVIEVLVNSENFTDLVQRATAVSTVLNADKELVNQQQQDLKQIEEEKLEIVKQEQLIKEQQDSLVTIQADLENNLLKRQETLTAVQEKYNTISSEISLAEEEKAAIQQKLTQAQESLKKEHEEAKAKAIAVANQKVQSSEAVTVSNEKAQSTKVATVSSPAAQPSESATVSNQKTDSNKDTYASPDNKKELYVTATAYSHEESTSGITATGYNIKENPNMKLIAVDPSIIPLGSKVWVEGYGEAIAGDTGGAIKGHKIDVLMPSGSQARSWGRKTVKVVILN